jgi:hypothetical protein
MNYRGSCPKNLFVALLVTAAKATQTRLQRIEHGVSPFPADGVPVNPTFAVARGTRAAKRVIASEVVKGRFGRFGNGSNIRDCVPSQSSIFPNIAHAGEYSDCADTKKPRRAKGGAYSDQLGN